MSDVLVKHAFVSPKAASPDATKIDGPKWNATLLFTGGVDGDVPIRDSTAGTGAAWSSSKASVTPSLWFNYAAWGDSLTAGTGGTPYPTTLATLTGQAVYNGGVGGDTSTQIATRFAADTTHLGNFVIIWSGRNDFATAATVKTNIAAMVAALPSPKRFLVLSILNGTGEPTGNANYTTITTLNADLAALYPANYLDIRAYLVSLFDPGTPQDVTDHTNDVPPSTLRSDTLHLNTAGYTAVANRIRTWLLANDVAGNRVARLSDELNIFASPPSIGNVTAAPLVSGTVVSAGSGTSTSAGFLFTGTTHGFYAAGSQVGVIISGSPNFLFGLSGPTLHAAHALNWGSSAFATPDLFLYRDAANTTAQRNGTTAQLFRLYNTFTNSTNYERGFLRWTSNQFEIGLEEAGTGVARAMRIRTTANGSGIIFATSNTDRWGINSTGILFANTDNASDIGLTGANRPRNIFVASSLVSKVKAGTPTDADVTNPADGMMVLDSTASKIWVRLGGAWKGVAVA